jgi:hypothetical protein
MKRLLQSAALALVLMLSFVAIAFLADPLNLPLLLTSAVYWVILFPSELFKIVFPDWYEASFERQRNLSLVISFLIYTALFYIALSWRARREALA